MVDRWAIEDARVFVGTNTAQSTFKSDILPFTTTMKRSDGVKVMTAPQALWEGFKARYLETSYKALEEASIGQEKVKHSLYFKMTEDKVLETNDRAAENGWRRRVDNLKRNPINGIQWVTPGTSIEKGLEPEEDYSRPKTDPEADGVKRTRLKNLRRVRRAERIGSVQYMLDSIETNLKAQDEAEIDLETSKKDATQDAVDNATKEVATTALCVMEALAVFYKNGSEEVFEKLLEVTDTV